MPDHDDYIESITQRIADYRAGELPRRTVTDVRNWIEQFPSDCQASILAEMDHILERTYFSKSRVERIINDTIMNEELVGPDPWDFWRRVKFLQIQRRGDSQRHMLGLVNTALGNIGLSIGDCGTDDGPYMYVDDFVFSGTHLRWDLIEWIRTHNCPPHANVIIFTIGRHRSRYRYNMDVSFNEALICNKLVVFQTWWHTLEIVDTGCRNVDTECFHPKSIPDGPYADRLLAEMGVVEYIGRRVLTTPSNRVFSSEDRRATVEQEFLVAGLKIKYELCLQLRPNHWPLGYDVFKTPGFGSTLITYRNCPNNAPLALWADYQWKPLFPRRNNR